MFIASNRWLDRFKKCCGLYEKEWLAEEADCEAAAEYPEYLKKLMEGNGHLPEEVFKADETVLFWKHMPTCTSIAKDEKKTRGFKPGKDKLKILLCSNVSGDFLIKSMLLHRFQNSCPLKRECQKHFSVYMKGNHKIWIDLPLSPHCKESPLKHRARWKTGPQEGEDPTVVRSEAGAQRPERSGNSLPPFPTRRNWPPAAERSLPLETVPGTLEAPTLRPSPARGMFRLPSLTALLAPNSSTRGHQSNVCRSQAGDTNG